MDGNCSLLIPTCPDFDLKKDIAKTVLLAALGAEDPCKDVGNKNSNGFTAGEYDWNYAVGQKLTYYAKKGGPASMTDYDFRIEFDDGEPRVWVEDVGEIKNVGEVAKNVLESAKANRTYSDYILRLYVGNQTVGSAGEEARAQLIAESISSWEARAAFTGACTAATLACSAALGISTLGAGAGEAIREAITGAAGCFLASYFGPMAYQMAVSTEAAKEYAPEALLLAQSGTLWLGTAVGRIGEVGLPFSKYRYLVSAGKSAAGIDGKIEALLKTAKAMGLKNDSVADVLAKATGMDQQELKTLKNVIVRIDGKDLPLGELRVKDLSDRDITLLANTIRNKIINKDLALRSVQEALEALKKYNGVGEDLGKLDEILSSKDIYKALRKNDATDVFWLRKEIGEDLARGNLSDARKKIEYLKEMLSRAGVLENGGVEDVLKNLDAKISEGIQAKKALEDLRKTGVVELSDKEIDDIVAKIVKEGGADKALERVGKIEKKVMKNAEDLSPLANKLDTEGGTLVKNLLRKERLKELGKGMLCDAAGVAAGTMTSYLALGNSNPPSLDVHLPVKAVPAAQISATGSSSRGEVTVKQ